MSRSSGCWCRPLIYPTCHCLLTALPVVVSAYAGQLHVADWWLSPSASAPPSTAPALRYLASLHVDVARGMDEATLAVLLDETSHPQELTLHSGSPLAYDVLVWVGERCHELRKL